MIMKVELRTVCLVMHRMNVKNLSMGTFHYNDCDNKQQDHENHIIWRTTTQDSRMSVASHNRTKQIILVTTIPRTEKNKRF